MQELIDITTAAILTLIISSMGYIARRKKRRWISGKKIEFKK